jgi:hypothetical protein
MDVSVDKLSQLMAHQTAEFNNEFIKEYLAALERGKEVFAQRSSEGRNKFLGPISMAPFGMMSWVTIIYQKTLRLVGNVLADNMVKAVEECEDIINYCAMAIAWRKMQDKYQSDPGPGFATDVTEMLQKYGGQK